MAKENSIELKSINAILDYSFVIPPYQPGTYPRSKLKRFGYIQWYAFIKYALKNKNDALELEKWLRVVRNLTENSIFNDEDEYSKAIKSIFKMLNESNNIYEYLADDKNVITGFLGEQIDEERLKAKLILKNRDWENRIIEAEKNYYFIGQISFLIDFSELTIENAYDEKIKKKFDEYFIKAKKVFSNECLFGVLKNYIWERALLCKGDYLISNSNNYSFCNENGRDIGWKRLLRYKDKRQFVKQVFDEIKVETIGQDLQNIIQNSNTSDWRKYFIKRIGLIEQCGTNKFIRFNEEDENDILLLGSSRTSGYHFEYYSYALYLKLIEIGNKVICMPQNSITYDKCISSINEKQIKISYQKINEEWKYVVELNETEKHSFDIENLVIEFLKENNFIISKFTMSSDVAV